MRNKYKNEDYKGDELFQDPLLLVEWDNAGIRARTANNAQNTKEALITCMYINITSQNLLRETLYKANIRLICSIFFLLVIRSQPGYTPFPTITTQPDCAFPFSSRQALSATIAAVSNNNWSKHVNGVADVGYAYSVLVPKKGQLDVAEEPVVFNI